MTEFSSVTTGTGECNEDQLGSKNGASTTIWTSTDLLSALKKMGVKWLGLFVCLLCTSALATHKSRFWVWFGNVVFGISSYSSDSLSPLVGGSSYV